MRFILFKDRDGLPRAVHADNVDELYIKDYGETVAVKADYTIAGRRYTTAIQEFEFTSEAEEYLAALVNQLNEDSDQ